MLVKIDDFVWGLPLILLIICTGIYLTIRVRGLQIRRLGRALKFMVRNEEGGEGEILSFGALCTALSATIGTGNIVGVVAKETNAYFRKNKICRIGDTDAAGWGCCV